MKHLTLLIIFCFSFVALSFADEQNKRKIAEDILILLKADKKVAASVKRIVEMQESQLEDILAPKAALDIQDKITRIYEETLNWDNVKKEYIDLYVDNFTEGDLKNIFDFYSSETGRKLLEKQQAITQEGIDIGDRKIQEAVPKIQDLIRAEAEASEGGEEGFQDFPEPEKPQELKELQDLEKQKE